MPPVAAAAVIAGGAFVTLAPAATTLAIGASVGLTAAGTATAIGIIQQLAVGVAFSALSQALAPKQGQGPTGTKISMGFGENQSGTRLMGRFCTAGDLVFHGSHGAPSVSAANAFYTQVIELADWPARLSRVWINGEWAKLKPAAHPDYGWPVEGYEKDGKDFLWVKFYDGTQTSADPMLAAKYQAPATYPWLADMIGLGVPYLIVTARYSPEVHRGGKPQVMVELDDYGLYDPRRDSTAGGSGAQRWNNWRTWEPTNNPQVMIYNIKRGLHDPITGEFLWGGQGIAARDLPASTWFAAMNECDLPIDRKNGGAEPQYRAGLEIKLSDEPASVIEELLKACQGVVAEVAGTWLTRCGAPGLPVYAYDDDDVIVTSSDQFDPFPSLDATYNGVGAQYPEPESGWEAKDAPLRHSLAYQAEDGGRRSIANLSLPVVPYKHQVQRLIRSALEDNRRFRNHVHSLPPEAQKLSPIDTVAWTSARNGYVAKSFELRRVEDLPSGCVAIALREWDPSDYDWDKDFEVPVVIEPPRRPGRTPRIGAFTVEPATVKDGSGSARKPAIRLRWTETENVDAVRYRVRLASDGTHLPAASVAPAPDSTGATLALTLGGEPVTLSGVAVTYSVFNDVEALRLIISEGIVAGEDYEVQAIFAPTEGRAWSDWLPVTAPDVRIKEADLEDTIRARIDDAFDRANEAADDATAALTKANEVEATVSGLSEETLDRLDALTTALGEFDEAALANLTGIALAGMKRGWSADPTFHTWEAGAPTHWANGGIATYGSQETSEAFYGSGLLIDVPTGTGQAWVRASSDVAGQLPAADAEAEYVVVSAMLRGLSGDLSSGRLRAEWKSSGGSWIRGDAFGAANAYGRLVEDWGFVIDPDRTQSREIVWKRPVEASAVQLVCYAKQASETPAASLRLDYLDIRAATEAEVKAYLANSYADASIEDMRLTIVGPGGAIAAAQETLRAEFGAADAAISTSLVAVSDATSALAGRVSTVEATFGGTNWVRNPTLSLDGAALAAGVRPKWWTVWPAGWSVRARSSAVTALASAPTAFTGYAETDATARAFEGVPVKPGDVMSLSLKAAGAGSGTINLDLQMRLAWRDADGVVLTTSTRTLNITGRSWVDSAFSTVTAPARAATAQLEIRKTGTGVGVFTAVEARLVDGVAHALAQTAMAAATNAETAVATMRSEVAAEFDDFAAMVTMTATAVASAGHASSALVMRAVAGGGSAGIRLVAWDDEDGAGGAVLLDGRNVIAPGTLSAGEVVVTDLGFNMVPDDQLQSRTAWSNSDYFTVIPETSSGSADSLGEIRSVAGASNRRCDGRDFPVRPGMRLVCSAQIGRIGGSSMTARARIVFTKSNGDAVSDIVIGAVSGNDAAPQDISNTIVVPGEARRARWRWEVATTNGQVRFFAPSVVRQSKGSTLIEPEGIATPQLAARAITAEKADLIDFAAVNGWVETLTIAGEAVTVPVFARRLADYNVTGDYASVLDFNVAMGLGGTIMAQGVMRVTTSSTSGGWGYRIRIGGTTVDEIEGTGAHTLQVLLGARAVGAGTHTVSLQARRDAGILLTVLDATAFAMGVKR
ncbi:phage tail protein [Amaricoccus solimangrovi]|uniref:Uncharacterized protein n=1 Tax=Amaricoccus solimangrovi TaxID=2589815 RepID=A0A501WJL4_9RHOB|nr:phage tail protein [Amaricoccus solimangrovi]TPE47221.1 hypothetical protein FJM51_20415 [Amaricoccus solimangrovi]